MQNVTKTYLLSDNFLFCFSLFHSIESLYWTLFGMRGLTSYETNLGEETTLLRVFVGTWLLVGAVILLTVLTGLVASNFQNVYVSI